MLRLVDEGVLGRYRGSLFVWVGTMKSSANCSQVDHNFKEWIIRMAKITGFRFSIELG
ncbi:hypothetical protein Bca4012_023414 [Brassica carinata]